jgi:hypothetical protein
MVTTQFFRAFFALAHLKIDLIAFWMKMSGINWIFYSNLKMLKGERVTHLIENG